MSQAYLIQDDARLHLVWLQQLLDPELFPQDPIAQYYQSIQGVGFRAIYQAAAGLGVSPLLFARFLPLLLGLVTTIYFFQVTLVLFPNPASGFCTTLLLNQNIWFKDDLISASPRSFVYPLFCAFLYYALRRSNLPILITIGLMGLIYPQLVLVQIGFLMLQLLWQEQGRVAAVVQRRSNWGLIVGALGVAAVTILPFQLKVSGMYGSIVSAAQMQQMPEFNVGGRRAYFGVAPLQFMFAGASGLRFPLFPPILWLGWALPFWALPFWGWGRWGRVLNWDRSQRSMLIPTLRVLLLLAGVSIGLWGLAHLLFPQLYLPSRYTFYSLRIGMALAAGIGLFLIGQASWQQWQQWLVGLDAPEGERSRHRSPYLLLQSGLAGRRKAGIGFAVVCGLLIGIVPAIPPLFLSGQGWVRGEYPAIYQFLAQQPNDQLIGSLALEADNIPAFAARSVLVSRELALAYHLSFYQQMQARVIALLEIHYSADLLRVQSLLQNQGIDFLLVDRQFAHPDYLPQQDWLVHSSFQAQVQQYQTDLSRGQVPALSQVIDRCTVLSENNLIILPSECIISYSQKSSL
ncbi:MAG: hypothetical protein MUF72_09775 [Elainella sp. Prado103]|nr:hypothetical protein [Elainella sp. Prado103]